MRLLRIGENLAPIDVVVLLLSDGMALDPCLPELYAVLHEDRFVELLRTFSGRTVKIPTVAQVREAYYSVTAYQRVEEKRSNGLKAREAVNAVSLEMGVPTMMTAKRYGMVRKVLVFVTQSAAELSQIEESNNDG